LLGSPWGLWREEPQVETVP